jgi:hypothetical protein
LIDAPRDKAERLNLIRQACSNCLKKVAGESLTPAAWSRESMQIGSSSLQTDGLDERISSRRQSDFKAKPRKKFSGVLFLYASLMLDNLSPFSPTNP